MIDKPSSIAHVLSVHHVAVVRIQTWNIVDELVEAEEEAIFDFAAFRFTLVGFVARDDFAEVGVDEFALDQIFGAVDTPAAVAGLEDPKWDSAAFLHDAAFANWAAFA